MKTEHLLVRKTTQNRLPRGWTLSFGVLVLGFQTVVSAQGLLTPPTQASQEKPNESARFLPLPSPPGMPLPGSQIGEDTLASLRFVPLPTFEELPPAPPGLCELASALGVNESTETPYVFTQDFIALSALAPIEIAPVSAAPNIIEAQDFIAAPVNAEVPVLAQQDKVVGSDFPKKMTRTGGLELLSKPLDPYAIIRKSDAKNSRPEKQEFIEKSWQNPISLASLASQPDPRYLRYWPGTNAAWDSPAFCYHPLYFEQPNFERYGIGYGRPTSALVSAGRFFCDVTLLPIHIFQQTPHSCECTLGHRRPGDCNPIQR